MPEVNNICDDQDLMFLIVSGIRYCIGRNAYAPSIANDVIRMYWHQLDGRHRDLIHRDVKEHVDKISLPFAIEDMNKDVWTELLSWIEADP